MSDLSRFEELVKRARLDAPARVDVAQEVLASVRVMRSSATLAADRSIDRLAMAFAAASVLAASIVAMVAWQLVEQPMVAELPNPFVVQVMSPQ